MLKVVQRRQLRPDASHLRPQCWAFPAFPAIAGHLSLALNAPLAGGVIPRLPIVDRLGLLGLAFRCPSVAQVSSPIVAWLVFVFSRGRVSNGSDGTALKATLEGLRMRFGWSSYAPAPASVEPVKGRSNCLMKPPNLATNLKNGRTFSTELGFLPPRLGRASQSPQRVFCQICCWVYYLAKSTVLEACASPMVYQSI